MKKLVITLTALCSLSTAAWAGRDDYYTGSAGYASELEWELPDDGGEMYIWGDYMPMRPTYENVDAIWNRDAVRPLITSIRMTNGQNIGAHAFKNLENLVSYTYKPSSGYGLLKIGDYAFSQSTKLATVEIKNSSALRYIGERAFAGTAIKSFTIYEPEEYVNLEDNLNEMGINHDYCFIGANAFADCKYLSTVYMKDDTPFSDTYNNFLNNYAFLVVDNADVAATYRTAWPEIASRIVYLEKTVPFANEEVKEICVNKWDTNGDGELSYGEIFAVTDFGDAFAGNTTITKIDGLESFVNVTVIGSGTFGGCTALESITIPSHITDIADDAFTGCTNLKEIHFVTKTPFKDSFTIQTNERTYIIVPDDAVGTYDSQWADKKNLIFGEGHIRFQCPVTEQICVTKWDTNKDGGLSYEEAADVTRIGSSVNGMFNDSKITSFDELRYFTGLKTIGSSAFSSCKQLISITIPSSVNSIGEKGRQSEVFRDCISLKKVIFLDSDEAIALSGNYDGTGMFELCPLDTIYIGRTLDYSYSSSGGHPPFYKNKTLKSVTLGNKVTDLGNCTFQDCSGLTEFIIPENSQLTSIRWNALSGCKISEIILPRQLTSIEKGAFNGCKIPEIIIPESVTSIGENAFGGVPTVIFKSMNPSPAANFSSVTTYVVPDEAVETYRTAWPDVKHRIRSKSALENWKEVTCEAQPTRSHLAELIGEGNELDVVKLRIRGTINSYDMMVMRDKMQNLRKLDLTHATIVANSYNYGTGVSEDNVFPDFMTGEPLTNLLLPESITIIKTKALKNCGYIKEITIPDNVTSIGSYAFSGCEALSVINVSRNCKLQTIEEYAFQKTGLENVDFSKAQQLETIGQYAFDNSAINSISLSTSLNTIGDYAFNSCTSLYSLATTANIGNYAFSGCSALNNVTIEEGASTIGEYAFQDLSSLETVNIGKGVKKISKYAFKGCSGLKTVSLPESLNSLDTYAFSGCKALQSITIPDAVTSLGSYVFSGCTALEKVEIGMGLTTVSYQSFKGCTALKEVKLSPKTTKIESNVFENCTGLTEFHLPPYLTSIGSDAFKGCSNLTEIYAYMPDVPAIAASTFSNYSTSTLYAPAFLFDAYYYNSGWCKFLFVKKCDLRPGDYEAFYTNKDLYFKEGEERITHDRPIVELGNQGSIIVEGAKQEFTTVDMLRGTTSSSLIGDKNIVMDELRVKINVSANRWYFLCFPYDVTISECTYPGKYAWRYYDGAARAANGNGGWQKIQGDVLKAGVGYIFQSNTAGNLIVKFADPEFGGDRPTTLQAHGSTNAANASWNFVGNPYACYYNLVSDDFASPITVWNGTTYVAYRPGDDNYHLQPYEAFFVQKTEDASAINFSTEGRETYSQSVATAAAQTRASFQRSITNNRFIVNLTISDNDTAAIDRTRLVMNNKASCNYELACDASKFISEDAAAQIYTLEGSVKMAINERPGQGKVRIGYTAQKAGKLRIEAQRMDSPMELLDTKTNRTFDLAQGAYEFTTEAGTFDNRFVICTSRGADEINNLTAATGVVIGMQEGGLNIGGAADKLVAIYGTNGTLVAEQYGNGYVALPSGIYVVKVDGHSAKMYVK